ncbi:DUF397 domain-containing protein [Streptomyces sp. CT34]|uniref:DUF397 domain-containing protein n=1 Tax=Streptomyces sp. CT34 TaxID=1553907 RepID=UPI0005B9B674|nr:DUF397 domain-containing protein [Streptomyces sp. CT34]
MATSQIDLSTARWRKSSYSNGDGGNCVEVAEGFPGAARWRKSSYSNGSDGDCVEVADGTPGIVPVRDSKDLQGPALTFSTTAWGTFIGAITAAGDC